MLDPQEPQPSVPVDGAPDEVLEEVPQEEALEEVHLKRLLAVVWRSSGGYRRDILAILMADMFLTSLGHIFGASWRSFGGLLGASRGLVWLNWNLQKQ